MHDPDAFPGKDAANEALESRADRDGDAADRADGVDAEQELHQAVARAEQYHDQFLRAKAESGKRPPPRAGRRGKGLQVRDRIVRRGLLPVADSLEKASAGSRTQRQRRCAKGIELTLRQLKAAFAKGNLKEIDPAGREVRSALSSGDFDGAGRRRGAESCGRRCCRRAG